MPAYSFQEQFAPAVEQGKKRQTIRPPRKRPTRPGDTLYLYTGMRTRRCRLLRVATCRAVTPITIHPDHVILDGRRLSPEETLALARADGFENVEAFFDFFRRRYGLPVRLELVEW